MLCRGGASGAVCYARVGLIEEFTWALECSTPRMRSTTSRCIIHVTSSTQPKILIGYPDSEGYVSNNGVLL